MPVHPIELRQRVIDAVHAGGSIHGVAARFAVSPSFVKAMKKLHRETGSVARKPSKAGRPRSFAGREEEIRGLVAARADLTLERLREALRSAAAISTVADELERLRLSYKKRPSRPPNRTAPTSRRNASSSAPTKPRWTAVA